jgi:hypothetical protein
VKDVNGWVDEFGLKGDYSQIPKIPSYQKHHIIPQSMDHPLGFDVNQNRNIVQLPTSSSVDPTRTVHRGKHNGDYDDMIRSRLDAIDALDANDAIKKLHVEALMDDTGDDLRNKRIALNSAH